MCRTSISLAQKASFCCPSDLLLQRDGRFLKKVFKDIAQRCGGLCIDILHFLRCTALPGLFGEQFFSALDEDQDGLLDREEFVSGLLRLYTGSYEEVVELIFRVLDFGRKGYVTPEEFRILRYYLPGECLRCGEKITRNGDFEIKLRTLFGTNAVLTFADLLETMGGSIDFFDDILQALLSSLPPVIDETLSWGCRCTSPSCSIIPTFTLVPLKYEGRRLLFDLRLQALYGYASIDLTHVHCIILLKGVFVQPRGETEFLLKSLCFEYVFEAENEEKRDEWVTRLLEHTNFRWFDDYYETGELLGEGGSGKVLKVQHRLTRVIAAVKIIDKIPGDAKSELRLRRELDILRLSRHENLLEIYDVFETLERVYIVTEWVSGGSLFSWLEWQAFTIDEAIARKIVFDLANGLHFLHVRGIVHRDVKLENVLLTFHGSHVRAKLIDFGLSTFLAPGRKEIEAVGTLKYASPEMISRLEYTEKVDCWSLGVIVYILLRGTTPFYGKSEREVALKILRKRMTFDSVKWSGVSRAGREVVERLLNRKASDRLSLRELLCSAWICGEHQSC